MEIRLMKCKKTEPRGRRGTTVFEHLLSPRPYIKHVTKFFSFIIITVLWVRYE